MSRYQLSSDRAINDDARGIFAQCVLFAFEHLSARQSRASSDTRAHAGWLCVGQSATHAWLVVAVTCSDALASYLSPRVLTPSRLTPLLPCMPPSRLTPLLPCMPPLLPAVVAAPDVHAVSEKHRLLGDDQKNAGGRSFTSVPALPRPPAFAL